MIELALLTTLLHSPAYAGGNPCAGVDLQEDKFTHKQTASVRAHTAANTSTGVYLMVWWTAAYEEGSARLKLELPASGVRSEIMTPGYKIMLLLKDGSVLELTSNQEVNPSPQSTGYGIYTVWTVDFPVDKAMATQLASQPVTALRTPLPGGDVSWDMPRADGKDFTRAFTCYASLLP